MKVLYQEELIKDVKTILGDRCYIVEMVGSMTGGLSLILEGTIESHNKFRAEFQEKFGSKYPKVYWYSIYCDDDVLALNHKEFSEFKKKQKGIKSRLLYGKVQRLCLSNHISVVTEIPYDIIVGGTEVISFLPEDKCFYQTTEESAKELRDTLQKVLKAVGKNDDCEVKVKRCESATNLIYADINFTSPLDEEELKEFKKAWVKVVTSNRKHSAVLRDAIEEGSESLRLWYGFDDGTPHNTF